MRRTTWHLVTNALVLAWLTAAALVGFAHRAVPAPRWLLVHLLVLGGATTAIMIWSNHFAVTLLRRPDPPSHRAEGLRLATLTVGVLAVTGGVVADRWPVIVAGSVLVVLAVVAHVVSLLGQLRRALASRFAVCVRYYVAAGLLLPVGVGLGVTMARGSTSDVAHARLLAAHLLLNLLGWIGLTVIGTLVTLWPTLLRTRIADTAEADARRALPVLVGGVLVAAAGSLAGLTAVVALGLLAYLAGLAVAARPFVDTLRRKHPKAFPAWSVLLAGSWLAGTLVALLVRLLAADGPFVDEESLRWVTPSLLVGFVAQVLVGALTGLGPVVIGGGPAMQRRTIAVVERFAGARLVATNAGLLLCVLPVPSLVRVTCSTAVLVALAVTIPLLVRAAVVARRPLPEVPADDSEPAPSGPQRTAPSATTWLGSLAVGTVAVVVAVLAGVSADPSAIGVGARPAADESVIPTGRTTTVEVTAAGMRFTPDTVEVPYGDRLVIVLTNAGDQLHDLVLDNGDTSGRLSVGETATVDVGVVGRDIDGWCSVAGHRQMGMVFAVQVAGAPDTTAVAQETTPSADPSAPGHDASGHGDDSAAIDPMADPGAGFTAYDPALPPVPKGRVHRFTFRVQELQREVAPGVMQESWTFNGTAPGPVLHGRVGDRFVITLVNDGTMGHSIDFHAGTLAPDRPMRTIDPGERLIYRFTATRSGVWLYHCSTMPMSLHIANGLFGAVVIDPPGLPAVDREYLLVQSELYLGEPGGVSDATKINDEDPDAVVFNGYVSQYDHDPLVARVGERVRIWVLDAGPSRSSSFHVVGGQFDTVFTEGRYELRPGNAERGGAQVLPLLAAQGGFVELTFPEAGHYPFVSHSMVDAERGAHGIVHVTR